MSQFLVVMKKIVVDQAFVPAELDVDGVTVITPEVPLITHDEVDRTYIETAPAAIALLLDQQSKGNASALLLDIYAVSFNPGNLRPTLKDVRIKGRAAAPAKERITVETTDGTELGAGEF